MSLLPPLCTNPMQNLVKEYGQLIQEYKVLKQAYEKEKASPFAGSSTTVAETRPRDPYVLMLVDGNDYIVSRMPLRSWALLTLYSSTMNSSVRKKKAACVLPASSMTP